MWREKLRSRPRLPRTSVPGGQPRRPFASLDEAVGRIASTPLDRSKPLWEMYFIEGPGQRQNRGTGQDFTMHLADGVAFRESCLRGGMDPHTEPGGPIAGSYPQTDPRAGALGADFGRRSPTTCVRSGGLPGGDALYYYTAQGVSRVRKSSKKLSPELTRPFHPAAVVHEPPRRRATQISQTRPRSAPLPMVKETGKHLGVTINDMVLAILGRGRFTPAVVQVRRPTPTIRYFGLRPQ